MCVESKRLTKFRPKRLTRRQKAELQAGQLATYRTDVREANARGLARYESLKRTGIWEHQCFIENFGEEDDRA